MAEAIKIVRQCEKSGSKRSTNAISTAVQLNLTGTRFKSTYTLHSQHFFFPFPDSL